MVHENFKLECGHYTVTISRVILRRVVIHIPPTAEGSGWERDQKRDRCGRSILEVDAGVYLRNPWAGYHPCGWSYF